jgi:signal transduction histidine kinase
MRSIAAKLWVMMVVLMVLVLGTLAVIQTKAIEVNYYRSEVRHMVGEAQELAHLLTSGAAPEVIAAKVAYLSQVFRANILIIDAAGRVCDPCGIRGDWAVYPGMLLSGSDAQAVLSGKTISRQGQHPLFEGVRFLWVGTPVMENGQTTGGIFMFAPLEPINARVRGLATALMGALLAGAALAGVLSFFTARKFSRRLVAMDGVARAMADGNYAARILPKGDDEVARLGASLNTLAQELQQRIAAVEQMDQARRGFVTAVSHELRTPLSIIQGYTEAILDGMATEAEKEQYLKAIYEESERLHRLTDELLDLRRMEAGAVSVRREEIRLEDVAAGAAARFNTRAADAGIDFQVNAAPSPPVAGDAHRLEQVVVNLLENAFRFTPAGGKVMLAVRPGTAGVELSVTDSGAGIAAADLPYIWDKFYRTDRARTRYSGGSGLGLAIVREIVELHGGRVEVTSVPGEGSVFTVTLPAYEDKIQNTEVRSQNSECRR